MEPNYNIVKEYIFKKLKKELPKNLYFHNVQHTEEVLNAAERLANLEGISEEEYFNLKTGALYHDIGFIKQHKDHELAGIKIAEESLPLFGYNSTQVKIISGIISATRILQNPKTKLGEILCDADLDNLGREDFYLKTELLRLELSKVNKIRIPPRKWYEQTLNFLEQHNYFTESAKKLRQKKKEEHIKEIKELLESNN